MSDNAVFFLIFGTAVGIAIAWFIVQTVFLRKLKALLKSDGWTIVPLSLFRHPKTRLAKIADSYVLRRNGRTPLLVAEKINGGQLQLFEINAMSSPAPIVQLPLYNVATMATTGLYTMTFLAMPINDELPKMKYGAIKIYLKENTHGINVFSSGANLPNRWQQSYLANRDAWQKS